MDRYQTVAYCTEPGCCCDHRAGIILYDGPDREAALGARADTPAGYEVAVEEIASPAGVRY